MNTFSEKLTGVIQKIKSSKKLSLLAIILLVAAIPLTVFLGQKVQEIRQYASTNQATITVNPTTVHAGETVKVTWTLPQPSATPSPTITATQPPAPTITKGFHCATQAQVTGYMFTVSWPQTETGITGVQISPNDTFSPVYTNTTSTTDDNNFLAKGPGGFANFQATFLVNTPYYIRLVRNNTIMGAATPYSLPSSCTTTPTVTPSTTPTNIPTPTGVPITATISMTPQSVPRGQQVTLHWTYTSGTPSATDQFEVLTSTGVHAQSLYVGSCAPTPATTTPALTGTCTTILSQNYGPGVYTVKLYKNAVTTNVLATTTFTVTNASGYNIPSLNLIKKAYAQSTVITGAETLQLFKQEGATYTTVGKKIYATTCHPQATDTIPTTPEYSGGCSYEIPKDAEPGSYIIRMLATDGTTILGESPVITVTPYLSTGLISYWTLDETIGDLVKDSIGTNDAVASGSAIVEGKIQKARSFTLNTDKVEAPPKDLGLTAFSIGAWIFPTGTNSAMHETIIRKQKGPALSWGLTMNGPQNQLQFGWINPGQCTEHPIRISNESLSLNQWHYVAATKDASGSATLYIDGSLAPSASKSSTQSELTCDNGTAPITIGNAANDPTVNFLGTIDEVGLWNRALSEDEIKTLAGGKRPTDQTPTITPQPKNGFTISAKLTGIGSPSETIDPKHPIRPAILTFFDSNNMLVFTQFGKLMYDATTGTFKGIFDKFSPCPTDTPCMPIDDTTTSSGCTTNDQCTTGQTCQQVTLNIYPPIQKGVCLSNSTISNPPGCTTDAQCNPGDDKQAMKCFKNENYSGTCKPADTICAQAEVKACTFEQVVCAQAPCPPREVCATFPNQCVVPPGWVKEGDPKPIPVASQSSYLLAGNYTVKIQTSQFLRKQIPGIVTIKTGETVELPSVTLITGDINNDNKINILDFNLLASCYGQKMTSDTCPQTFIYASPPTAPLADLNDDGVVDGIDYNLFIRSLATKEGD